MSNHNQKNIKHTRIDIDFDAWCRKVAARRFAEGRDKKLRTPARITKALVRHEELLKQLEKDLKNAKFED